MFVTKIMFNYTKIYYYLLIKNKKEREKFNFLKNRREIISIFMLK